MRSFSPMLIAVVILLALRLQAGGELTVPHLNAWGGPAPIAPVKPLVKGRKIAIMGHSCVASGMKALQQSAAAIGMINHEQFTIIRPGFLGSVQRHWEREVRENPGPLFQALATGKWDSLAVAIHRDFTAAECSKWIDKALASNAEMSFFVQDVWVYSDPDMESGNAQGHREQLRANAAALKSGAPATDLVSPYKSFPLPLYAVATQVIHAGTNAVVEALRAKYGERVFIIRCSTLMLELYRLMQSDKLPGHARLAPLYDQDAEALFSDHIHPGPLVRELQGMLWCGVLYHELPDPKGFAWLAQHPELDPDMLIGLLADTLCNDRYSGVLREQLKLPGK